MIRQRHNRLGTVIFIFGDVRPVRQGKICERDHETGVCAVRMSGSFQIRAGGMQRL